MRCYYFVQQFLVMILVYAAGVSVAAAARAEEDHLQESDNRTVYDLAWGQGYEEAYEANLLRYCGPSGPDLLMKRYLLRAKSERAAIKITAEILLKMKKNYREGQKAGRVAALEDRLSRCPESKVVGELTLKSLPPVVYEIQSEPPASDFAAGQRASAASAK